jgi:hypothetical protein
MQGLMPPPEPDLTPVAVAASLAAVLLGPQYAATLGAYSIILIGWCAGVLIGVYRMPPGPRIHAAAFVAVSLLLTMGATVPLAEAAADALRVVAPWMSSTEAKGLLFPVAVLLPAVGHSWAGVATWAWGALRRRIAPKESQP